MKKLARKMRATMKRLFLKKKRPTVLCYHSIGANDAFVTVHPDVFKRQMAYLKDVGLRVVSLEECLSGARRGVDTATVALTFDDGYEDFAETAHPVLKEFGFPSAVFLPTGLMGRSLASRHAESIDVMSWERAGALVSEDVIFGSHTVTHPKLSKLSESEVDRELCVSKEEIEKHLGIAVSALCYPYGHHSSHIINQAERAGYTLGVTVEPGHVTHDTDAMRVPRMTVHSEMSMSEFIALFL